MTRYPGCSEASQAVSFVINKLIYFASRKHSNRDATQSGFIQASSCKIQGLLIDFSTVFKG